MSATIRGLRIEHYLVLGSRSSARKIVWSIRNEPLVLVCGMEPLVNHLENLHWFLRKIRIAPYEYRSDLGYIPDFQFQNQGRIVYGEIKTTVYHSRVWSRVRKNDDLLVVISPETVGGQSPGIYH